MIGESHCQGGFTAPFLRPNSDSIAVEAFGFKRAVREGIVLNAGQNVTLNIALEVGDVTEQLTVNAGRSINGSRIRQSEFLLDGAPNYAQPGGNNLSLAPGVDAIQEFRIRGPAQSGQRPLERINGAYLLDWAGTLTSPWIVNARLSLNRSSGHLANLPNGIDLKNAALPEIDWPLPRYSASNRLIPASDGNANFPRHVQLAVKRIRRAEVRDQRPLTIGTNMTGYSTRRFTLPSTPLSMTRSS